MLLLPARDRATYIPHIDRYMATRGSERFKIHSCYLSNLQARDAIARDSILRKLERRLLDINQAENGAFPDLRRGYLRDERFYFPHCNYLLQNMLSSYGIFI